MNDSSVGKDAKQNETLYNPDNKPELPVKAKQSQEGGRSLMQSIDVSAKNKGLAQEDENGTGVQKSSSVKKFDYEKYKEQAGSTH